jgi:nicotinate phosphoribosyltransferase
MKVSDQPSKTTNPGILRVRRYRGAAGESIADAIYSQTEDLSSGVTIIDPMDATKRRRLDAGMPYEELLVPVFRGGRRVYNPPPLEAIRARTATQLATFHEGHKRLKNPHLYPVGLSQELHERKSAMIRSLRGQAGVKAV